jgi:hypothetical protein
MRSWCCKPTTSATSAAERTVNTDFSIVAQFKAECRGVAEYYRLAFKRHRLGT